ncbi:MAG: C25 family cysteine peptidase, partial [Mariprofundaceae bacterium]|nr:C25 family cysteine peptidase [Mariprofundaceae bacterium]
FGFEDRFDAFPNMNTDSLYVDLRVMMHGMTNSSFCDNDHKAVISITDQFIGTAIWDGQEPKLFEKQFYVSGDSINIFPTGNRLNVIVNGDNCELINNDEIRINWYEFEYWRYLITEGNHFEFKTHEAGSIRYWLTQWTRQNMKVYIPSRNKLISNADITNDQFNTVLFMDTANVGDEYFCVSNDYYLSVDSIVSDISSDLRGLSNGADYIIITHPDFLASAQELAQYRRNYLPDPDIQNPRVMVVDVRDIYDEFAYGLLDPYAIKDFVKYAFDNWQEPAPSYIVLLGDMSYDYRGVLENSRSNFIPSIPYFAYTYGEAVSDNAFVAVSGSDVAPDLAIGRISCETPNEADILIQKIKNYPDDPDKLWRETGILLASGLDEDDENQFGFNDASLQLGNAYLTQYGYRPKYVFNFPTKPEHEPYQGGEIEMRDAINQGAVIVNYYGHGGGLQWDLVFTDDDIDLLENGGKLPVVISVTCYTAHFDNQKVFGEHFNLVENSGSIGFFGSAGLTYWGIGKAINSKIFDEIFSKKNFVIGKAILNAKNRVPSSGVYGIQVALLTYLGDPAVKLTIPEYPDFGITSSDISITPKDPLVNDTVKVKVKIHNWGRIFPFDSVNVKLHISSSDTNYLAGVKKLGSFNDEDSVYFTWVPTQGNLFQLTVSVNETDSILEVDHSDNVASHFFLVFNISKPNVLKPIDGFSTSSSSIEFVFSDIGHYLNRDLTYYIEIDTSLSFESPIVSSGALTTNEVLVKWNSPNLPQGTYFWRARIHTGSEYGNWSPPRSFSIMDNPKGGYYAHKDILKTFSGYNINYSDSSESLHLNTSPLPPRPSDNTFLGDIIPEPPLADSMKLTTITTDGT